MPTPQRISLIEAYDNRDVVAWLVRHSTEIDDLKTAVDALPDNDEFVLTIGDQTISGTKSFVNKIVAAGGIEADTLVKINADLQVFGDIYQNGSAYDTHAEQLYTTKDYILMRDGAAVGLAPGAMSGLEVIKYDGTNNLRLAADASGVARIGDVGDEQPLLTRAEAADLTDGDPLCWDSTEQKAVPFTILAGQNITITSQTHGITIESLGGGTEGVWTKRTPSLNWSDLLEWDGNVFKAKKDMLITNPGNNMSGFFFPKDFVWSGYIRLYVPITKQLSSPTNGIATVLCVTIKDTNYDSSGGTNFEAVYSGYTLTTDGSTITVTSNSNLMTSTISKSSFVVYVKG